MLQTQPLHSGPDRGLEEPRGAVERCCATWAWPTRCGWRPCAATTTARPGRCPRKTEAQQMARLLQRADISAPAAMPCGAAAHARHRRHAGQLLRRRTPGRTRPGPRWSRPWASTRPGAFVRLASLSGRGHPPGHHRHRPRVAVVTNRDGMPAGEPIPRDTGMPPWKVTGVVLVQGRARQPVAGPPPAADGLTPGRAPKPRFHAPPLSAKHASPLIPA